jgi:hypothetical protein
MDAELLQDLRPVRFGAQAQAYERADELVAPAPELSASGVAEIKRSLEQISVE